MRQQEATCQRLSLRKTRFPSRDVWTEGRRCWEPGECVEQREGKDGGGELRGRKPGEQEWAGQQGDPHLQGSALRGCRRTMDSVDP